MTNTPNRSDAFMLDDDEVCVTYLDSGPAHQWTDAPATSADNTQGTAARVLLAARRPRTGRPRTEGNRAPARP